MMRSLEWWKYVAAFATLSVGARSMNSINLNFENTEDIDLSFLGIPNLDQYDVKINFDINERENGDCIYDINIDFDPNGKETSPGDSDFEGNCKPNDSQGNAEDGLPWHAHRRHWIRLPEDVVDATGLNHFSMEWVPCGRAPAGFQQARWDLNFYTVDPEHRSFMVCDVFKTPSVCQYNQTSHIGRRIFSIPRLAIDKTFLPNLPLDFAPDPEFPEAREYEGLTHYDPLITPNITANWTQPTFLMTTYDAAAVSWRAMIPHDFFINTGYARSSEYQYYVYQTMMGLPSNWTTEYENDRMNVHVYGNVLKDSRRICRGSAARIKRDPDAEIKIMFEDKVNSDKAERAADMVH